MPEFMFRNLSVKLYSAGGDAGQACGAGTSQQAVFRNFGGCWNGCSAPATYVRVFCDPDSHIQLCGDATTFLCDWPSRPACDPPSLPACDAPTVQRSYVDPLTQVVIPAGSDIREELATLKATLQRSMAAVEARQQELENTAKPRSVEQIDDLKSQLLAAVAELDEQRARMEGGQAPASG